jgi:2'-5' RNA ligase
MRSLFTVAFPEVDERAAAFIHSFRQANSPAAPVEIAPHFTLVFACAAVPEQAYLAQVAQAAASAPATRFVCKYAMLGADDADDRAYVFLVPDEGFAAISLLHDRLYTGPLTPHLRLDLPYTPHITIGVTHDRHQAKALCDGLNRDGLHIEGRLRELTVGTVYEGKFQPLAAYPLSSP